MGFFNHAAIAAPHIENDSEPFNVRRRSLDTPAFTLFFIVPRKLFCRRGILGKDKSLELDCRRGFLGFISLAAVDSWLPKALLLSWRAGASGRSSSKATAGSHRELPLRLLCI